jgi:hypothetical protein
MKTRLRTLTVDGMVYRWSMNYHFQGMPGGAGALVQVRIWGSDKAAAPLLVEVLIPQLGTIYVLPAEVRRFIDAGLASGWDPQWHGTPQTLPAERAQQATALLLARYLPGTTAPAED